MTTVPYKPYDLAKQVEETIENGTRKELVSSNYLTLNKYDMTGYNKVKNDKPFQLVSIIEGQGTVEGKEVKKGDHFVVCSDQKEVDFDGTMTVFQYFPFLLRVEPVDFLVSFEPGHLLTGIDA